MAHLVAENIKTFLRNHPEVDIIDLWPEDGIGCCQCPKCKAQGACWDKKVSNTDYYMRFVNDVAARIGREFPDVTISALAYVNVIQAPKRIVPADNVMVLFCPYWRCFVHRLDDLTCPTNATKGFHKAITDWLAFKKPVAIYAYYYGMGCHCLLPFPILDAIRRDMKIYRQMGVSGIAPVVLQTPHELNIYAAAKLAWQPDHTPDQIIKDYCRRYYAQVAAPVEAFYKSWEKTFSDEAEKSLHTKLYWKTAADQHMNEDLFRDLENYIDQAEAADVSDDTRQRIRHVRQYYLEYPRLAKAAAEKLNAAETFKREGDMEQYEKTKRELLKIREKLLKLPVNQSLSCMEIPKLLKKLEEPTVDKK